MARFRMTVITKIPAEDLKIGDIIIVEAQHESQISGMMVREAVKQQLGKHMHELYHYGHKGKKWDIKQIG